MNAWISEDDDKSKWLLTTFYGHPDRGKRKESWKLLANLKPSNNVAWCVLGYFNEVVS